MSRIKHIEFLVEEYSMDLTLRRIAPKILGDVTYDVHPFSGKPDLLRKLGGRLKGYSTYAKETGTGIVVIVDEDREDCVALKQKLEDAALLAGLPTVSSSSTAPIVLNRLAVEELEAWLLGDAQAVAAAYPKIPLSFAKSAKFRDPDAIVGGTAEALEFLLKKYGYVSDSLKKTETAVAIARHMDVTRNRSNSFNEFRNGVAKLLVDSDDPVRSC